MRVVNCVAIVLLLVGISTTAAQQEFPIDALIRGENVRLRLEPGMDSQVTAYLQRGDRIFVTGEGSSADGEMFTPIEVLETGEAGWVRDLFINPTSLAPVDALPAVAADAPRDDEGPNDSVIAEPQEKRRNQEKRKNRNLDPVAADEPVGETPEEPVVDEVMEGDVADADSTGIGHSVENPAPFQKRLSGGGAIVRLTNGRFADEIDFSTPKGGYKYLVFETRIEGDDADGHEFSAVKFSGEDADTGAGYDSAFVLVENALGSDTLSEGEYVTGVVVLEVQETASRVIVKYDPRPFDEEDLFWLYE